MLHFSSGFHKSLFKVSLFQLHSIDGTVLTKKIYLQLFPNFLNRLHNMHQMLRGTYLSQFLSIDGRISTKERCDENVFLYFPQ